MSQGEILLLQTCIFFIQTLVLAATGCVFWRQLVTLNKTNESASHVANLQSVLTYYQMMVSNPRVYHKLFGEPDRDDDNVKAMYVAFALLRLFDNWFIQHDQGIFPKSKGEDLWRAWKESARDAITRSPFLQDFLRRYSFAYSRSLRSFLDDLQPYSDTESVAAASQGT